MGTAVTLRTTITWSKGVVGLIQVKSISRSFGEAARFVTPLSADAVGVVLAWETAESFPPRETQTL